jgi:predicted PurR-regulated permease PerM
MNTSSPAVQEEADRFASGMLDVLIRAGLIAVMVVLCYRVFSPFLTLMIWSVILAVTLYPLHHLSDRHWSAAPSWAPTTR